MEAAKIQTDTQIFAASPYCDETVAIAKQFIIKNELTSDDVKLGRISDTVVVVTRKEILLLS